MFPNQARVCGAFFFSSAHNRERAISSIFICFIIKRRKSLKGIRKNKKKKGEKARLAAPAGRKEMMGENMGSGGKGN